MNSLPSVPTDRTSRFLVSPHRLPVLLASPCVACVLAATVPAAQAATHQFDFSGTLTAVNPSASGFPVALQGIAVGTPFHGTLSYEYAPTPVPNPYPSPIGLATMYALPSYTMSVNVGGQVLASWPAGASAFVWNDVSVAGPGDGLLFVNLAGPGQTQFQLGNTLYPLSQFASTALPTQTVPGGFVFQAGIAGPVEPWFEGSGNGLFFSSAVPEPAMSALWLVGLLGTGWWRLRRA